MERKLLWLEKELTEKQENETTKQERESLKRKLATLRHHLRPLSSKDILMDNDEGGAEAYDRCLQAMEAFDFYVRQLRSRDSALQS